jgi:hypothetical protein
MLVIFREMNFIPKNPLLAIGLAVVAGITIGALFAGGAHTTVADTASPTKDQSTPGASAAAENTAAAESASARIIELSRLLQRETRARQALEQKMEDLERQVAALDSLAGSAGPAAAGEQPGDAAEPAGGSSDDWFDEQALLDNGMDSSLVSELKGFFEQLEIDRLYLRDRAAREGWERDKLRTELQDIESREDEIRERLGDSAYDAYLYASGQPNRVAVTSVLASAQAGQAGIQSGDHIIRYDNERIYNWVDLRSATTSGSISDTVEVEVERDGETLQFYLARGPLGIRMDSLSVAP